MKEDDPATLEAYRRETFFRRGAGIATIIHNLQSTGFLLSDADLKGKKAVELGAEDGSGLYVLNLLGVDITGIDSHEYPEISSFTKNELVGYLPYFDAKSVDYLRCLPENSLDAIFGFNVVSNLWTQDVKDVARNVLKPDGFIVLTRQAVNMTAKTGSWPIGWPYWSLRNLFNEHLAHFENGRFVSNLREFADPQQLEKGVIQISPKIPFERVILPEVRAMVGYNF